MYTVTKKLVKLKVPWGHPVGTFMIFGAQRERESIVRSIQLLASNATSSDIEAAQHQ